jgi:hypothetical protein
MPIAHWAVRRRPPELGDRNLAPAHLCQLRSTAWRASCDARLEAELERAEILLLDRGATAEEIEAALGPHGYMRKMLVADRDRQIAAVTRWLSSTDGTLH